MPLTRLLFPYPGTRDRRLLHAWRIVEEDTRVLGFIAQNATLHNLQSATFALNLSFSISQRLANPLNRTSAQCQDPAMQT
jgi:hypothetical protein